MINDRTGELLAVKLVGDDGAATAAGAARGAALRVCLATRHPNLVRWAAPACPESGSDILSCHLYTRIHTYSTAGHRSPVNPNLVRWAAPAYSDDVINLHFILCG